MPRRNRLSTASLWPGLPQLWSRGMWSGLAVAVVFAILLDVLILSTLVWTESIGTNVRMGLWAGLIGTCLVSAFAERYGNRTRQPLQSDRPRGSQAAAAETGQEPAEKTNEDLFRSCQAQYLRGNWYEAETELVELLKGSLRDVEAELLLATLYRHLERFDEAGRWLAELERSEEAEGWSQEIRNERACLMRAVANEVSVEETTSSDGGSDAACD
ncbi:MAG: hypothetical protein ACC645_07880 [Pirellulales bacterium]